MNIGGGQSSLASSYQPGSPAQDIRLLAHHSPWLSSDAEGFIDYQLPSSEQAGKARIMLLSARDGQFGMEESEVIMRSDLDPIISWPRFVHGLGIACACPSPSTIASKTPANSCPRCSFPPVGNWQRR